MVKQLDDKQLVHVIGGKTEFAFKRDFIEVNEQYSIGKLDHYFYNRNINDLVIDYFGLNISRFYDGEYPEYVRSELSRMGLVKLK